MNFKFHDFERSVCTLSFDNSLIFHVTNCKPRVEKLGPQNQNGFARALLQLQLDRRELASNDADHSVDFLRRYRPRSALLPEQIYHVCREFIASLFQTKKSTAAYLTAVGRSQTT